METSSPFAQPRRPPPGDARRSPPLVLLMVLAVTVIAALAFWDEERESEAALDDFAQEQATLASSVAAGLSGRLADTGALLPPAELLEGAARVERPGAVRLFLAPSQGDELFAADGRTITSAPIRRGLAAGQASVWLSRAEAAELGLPPRRAAAGLAQVKGGRFGVAVVSTALRERDREQRARFRLVLGVIFGAGLVFAFGSVALRNQRRELLLERELDVTDLLRERDARLATAGKAAIMGTLAMGVAHEVGTPLGVIIGRAEQILGHVDGDERLRRSLVAIVEQAERIQRVIRGLLDVARGGAPVLDDVEPGAVLGRAVGLVEHRFEGAGLTLTTDVPVDLPAIRCDTALLEQALVNLLLNACDACEHHGHVDVKIRCDGDRVAFTVVDDGVGITADAAARATEPFFTTKPAGKGTGLGLAITNEIVKIHRGALSIEPASPRGTRASVIVPVPKGQAHAPA
jgi:two-component system, NtrC family, sensor kinase